MFRSGTGSTNEGKIKCTNICSPQGNSSITFKTVGALDVAERKIQYMMKIQSHFKLYIVYYLDTYV